MVNWNFQELYSFFDKAPYDIFYSKKKEKKNISSKKARVSTYEIYYIGFYTGHLRLTTSVTSIQPISTIP